MQLNNQQQKILEFLRQWESEEHIYDLMTFHSMEFYDDLEDEKFLEKWFDVDLTEYFEDKFPSFATEGGTGYIAFWYYLDLQGEAPIIRIDSYGGHTEILAGSLNDLVCILIHNIGFNGGWCVDNKPDEEDFQEHYEDLLYHYNKHNNTSLSIEEFINNIINKDREEFKQRALEIIDFKSEKEIAKNIKNHPSFIQKLEEFEKKAEYESTKITPENLASKLDQFDNLIKNEIFSVEEIIKEIEQDWPDAANTTIFQDWVKKYK